MREWKRVIIRESRIKKKYNASLKLKWKRGRTVPFASNSTYSVRPLISQSRTV